MSGVKSFLLGISASLVFLASPVMAQQMQQLSDEEMGGVVGQEGVLISLDYYYNSEKTDDLATTGQRLSGYCSTPNGGTSLGDNDCRFAIQLENRGPDWLVFKNGHASLSINRLSLDASFLGDASSAANTSFFDIAKFQDVSGNCLLETGNCSTATIQDMPAVRAHYPLTAGSYDPNTKAITGYEDVRFGLYFEGLAVEYGAGGYLLNDQGSFLGLNIADNAGNQARIAFGGDFYMYGF